LLEGWEGLDRVARERFAKAWPGLSYVFVSFLGFGVRDLLAPCGRDQHFEFRHREKLREGTDDIGTDSVMIGVDRLTQFQPRLLDGLRVARDSYLRVMFDSITRILFTLKTYRHDDS